MIGQWAIEEPVPVLGEDCLDSSDRNKIMKEHLPELKRRDAS